MSHAGITQGTNDSSLVGFGLSTANTLCNMLGGELSITSLPWYKTEVEFTFDIKRTNSLNNNEVVEPMSATKRAN